jgi:hypothetical protein
LLSKNIEKMSSWEARKFFEGEYRWDYKGEKYKFFDATFVKILRQLAWLFDNDNNFKKPSDITFTELSDSYIKESPNMAVLIKALEFKPDIIDQLPEEDRKKLELLKNCSFEEVKKLFAESKNKKEPEPVKEVIWTPEYKPGEVDIKIEEIEPDKIITPDLRGQSEKLEKGTSEELQDKEENNIGEDVSEKLSHANKKSIGEHGEMEVYLALRREYQGKGAITETDFGFKVINQGKEELEIVWLNKHNDKGKGCDFVIKKNGIEVEYIEVKTKVGGTVELIEVTGTQWEFARKLYEHGEGEKYSFYVVYNASKSNTEIKQLKNPIKLWKDGKLNAHPINFKL